MFWRSSLVGGLCSLFAALASAAAAPPTTTRSPTPILVELFTSEGCSSCPPADTLLERLVDMQPVAGALIVGVGQHVDYWNHQGWKDRFSSAALTERQRRYAVGFHVESIYTPQMVVDGRFELVGSDTRAARAAIDRALSLPHADVSLSAELSSGNRIAVTVAVAQFPKLSPGDRADILVAVTEDRLRSNVRGGENGGRLLAHAAVARRLSTIGEVHGDAASIRTELTLDREWQRDNVKIVAFVQERSSRRVLGAAAIALQGAHR